MILEAASSLRPLILVYAAELEEGPTPVLGRCGILGFE
jgi:hypothetical protein